MRHEAPRTAARKSVGKSETGVERVLYSIEPQHILAEPLCLDDGAEPILQQVNLVSRQVVEIATATCHFWLQSPGQFLSALVVQLAWRHGKPYLHRQHLADAAAHHNLLHSFEIGQIPPVESHKARDARQFADAVHTQAIRIARSQRLLYVGRLPRLHRHDGEGGMREWGSGDIDGIHLWVTHQHLGVCIIFFDVVAFGIRLRLLLVAAHHSHHLAALDLPKGRPALLLGHFAAADKAPFHSVLIFHSFVPVSLFTHFSSSLILLTQIRSLAHSRKAHSLT